MESSVGRGGQSAPLSYNRAPESSSHPPAVGRDPQVTAVCADPSLLVAPAAPTASLETATGLAPVARRLGQLLPIEDLLNLRHSLATNGGAHSEISRQAVTQCQTEGELLLAKALHCLSCPRQQYDQDLLTDLHDTRTMMAFFLQEIVPLYADWGLPLPDPVQDEPLAFVLKCQALDEKVQQDTAGAPCTARLLKRVVETGAVAVAFKMLKGLQQAKKQQLLVQTSLAGENGKTLLQEEIVYQKASRFWLKLLLAAAVFDLHPTQGDTPLTLAICCRKTSDAVAILLGAGADPNQGGRLLPVPISTCFLDGVENRLSKIAQLLSHSALDPREVSCAVHEAVKSHDSNAVTQLLAYPGTDPDFLHMGSWGSPLVQAVRMCLENPHRPPDMLRLLASKGCHLISLWYTADSNAKIIRKSTNSLYDLGDWLARNPLSGHLHRPSEERQAQLQAAIDQGWQDAAAENRKSQATGGTGLPGALAGIL